MEKPIDFGEINYNAYCDSREWKSFNGDPLPKWPDVKPEIQRAWTLGACAVLGRNAGNLFASALKMRQALIDLTGVETKGEMAKMLDILKAMPNEQAAAPIKAVQALMEGEELWIAPK